jgi:hypothetical protein
MALNSNHCLTNENKTHLLPHGAINAPAEVYIVINTYISNTVSKICFWHDNLHKVRLIVKRLESQII